MEKGIKISILCEDQAKMGFRDRIFLAQHGFSVFIEADKRILFDTGATDVFLHNAALFGIDLSRTDWVVLSHGHWDHADGLKALHAKVNQRMKLLVHPGVFVDRRKASGEYNGMHYTREEMTAKFDLMLSKAPYQLSDRISFLGQIPRRNAFEAQKTAFFYIHNEDTLPDFVLDDTALAVQTEKGLVIVTGCSHAGICNIVEYAKQITHQEKVYAVVGGFHLLGDRVQLEKTVAYFSKNKVDHLYPMHCTDLPSLSRFYETFGVEKLCAGDMLVL